MDDELKKLHTKGVSSPVSIWPKRTLIKSVLEPLQTQGKSSNSSDDEEREPDPPGPEYAIPEGKAQPLVAIAEPGESIYPAAPRREEENSWPDPPPPFPIPMCPPANGESGQIQPNLYGKGNSLSSVQQGILQARREGDLDAFKIAIPVTVRERVAPGVDPKDPQGVYEAVQEPFPFKVIEELKQAV